MEESGKSVRGLEIAEDISVGQFLLQGTKIGTLTEKSNDVSLRLGYGIRQKNQDLNALCAGILEHDPRRNKIYVRCNYKRYVPGLHDCVIGIVFEKHSEEYRLDINGTDTAVLSGLAFEGATKKNKPNLQIGALVFGRVTRASKNVEVEVSCIEPGSSKSWVGGECTYGELHGGNDVKVSIEYAHMLSKYGRNNFVFKTLGQYVPFESAVGLNGRVWVKGRNVRETAALSIAIDRGNFLEEEEWMQLVRSIFKNKRKLAQ